MVHALWAIWKERGLLTSNNKDIKHASEISSLLDGVHKALISGHNALQSVMAT